MKIALTSTVVRKDDLPSTAVDDDLVVLNLATNNYVGLDKIGRDIWQLLETPHTAGEICATMAERYEGEEGGIQQDVLAFLEELADEKLITVS